MSTLDDAIQHIRMGNREEGRQILEEMLEEDEGNEEVWLWLTSVVDNDEDREICLENVLALNPDNIVAQRGLDALRAGTFDANEMLAEVLDEEVEEEDPSTFIDEFVVIDEDDDLVMPSTMATGSKTGGFSLNPRLIILVVIGLIVILGLGGVAIAAVFFGAGGVDGGGEVIPIESPASDGAGGEEQPQPTATPTAEATPTATNTPRPQLDLPTSRPTDLPTPTATRVVSPTPSN